MGPRRKGRGEGKTPNPSPERGEGAEPRGPPEMGPPRPLRGSEMASVMGGDMEMGASPMKALSWPLSGDDQGA